MGALTTDFNIIINHVEHNSPDYRYFSHLYQLKESNHDLQYVCTTQNNINFLY